MVSTPGAATVMPRPGRIDDQPAVLEQPRGLAHDLAAHAVGLGQRGLGRELGVDEVADREHVLLDLVGQPERKPGGPAR